MSRVRMKVLLLCTLALAGVWTTGCMASPPPPKVKCSYVGMRNLDADSQQCKEQNGDQLSPLHLSHSEVLHAINTEISLTVAAMEMDAYVGEIRAYPLVTVVLIEYNDGAAVLLRVTPENCLRCALQPTGTRITEENAQMALSEADSGLIAALKAYAAEQGEVVRTYELQVMH